MDQFYGQRDLGKVLDEQGNGEGPSLTRMQIHDIGVQTVEKTLGPQPYEQRHPAERVDEHQLETVG
jgi:hypothetical protein